MDTDTDIQNTYDPGSKDDMDIVHTMLNKAPYSIPIHRREQLVKIFGDHMEKATEFSQQKQAAEILLKADSLNLRLMQALIPRTHIHKSVKDQSTEELIEQVRAANKLLPPEIVIDAPTTTN